MDFLFLLASFFSLRIRIRQKRNASFERGVDPRGLALGDVLYKYKVSQVQKEIVYYPFPSVTHALMASNIPSVDLDGPRST